MRQDQWRQVKHAAFTKEKIMASKFGFNQTSVPAALLRGAALAIALIVSASPALAAGPVTLTCRTDPGPGTQGYSMTLRINYATGLVEELAPSGKPYTNRIAPNARISKNAIVWSVKLMDTGLKTPVPMIWEGNIDRLSGTGWTQFSRSPYWHPSVLKITCRQATQKF
jgi:hypothetical protein